MQELTEERIARNDSTFRVANDRIAETAVEQGMEQFVPFICECAEPRCAEIIQLSLGEYEAIRAEPAHFLNAPGHERAAQGAGRVVSTHDRFVVVRKTGRAGAIARALDPRAEDEVA